MNMSTFSLDEITDSNESSKSKIYTCSFENCTAAFGKPSRLQQHIRVHTGERPFRCQKCDKSYTRSFHLKRHISISHELVAIQVFTCPVEGCGKTFHSDQKLKTHHANIHIAQRFKCSSCDKSFLKNQQLKIHEYQHTKILPYRCDFEGCNKEFLLPSRLKAHSKIHKGYTCEEEDCNQHFGLWSALRKHKSLHHSKKITCTICQASFKKIDFLKSHMKRHLPDREVFHCPIEECKRWFYYKSNMAKHVDYYHNPGQFKCKEEGCGKVFNFKASLVSHAKHHKPSIAEQSDTEKQVLRRSIKPRKPRSDLGKPKKPIAAILSGQKVTHEESQKIMRSLD